ncbi:MAG TPA: sulfatase-like hydrolase/transferase, partial [Chloroflexota bacterium]|nr:sulfatase-like hydrolase/transferase [Chloroflexota bacterium]
MTEKLERLAEDVRGGVRPGTVSGRTPAGLNVLLIMTDQQRADTLGCAGKTEIQTPNLDRLAAEGMRCERAYVQNPICMPSRATL